MSSAGKTTPYQGNRRCFGEFQCLGCNSHWQSGNSWKNTGQMCKKCNIMVYPNRQRPLEKSEDDSKIDKNKPHLQNLCERCQKLGYDCSRGTR